MNDIFQFWLLVFGIDTLRYLLGAGGVALVLFVLARQFSESRRIQTRRAGASDVKREVAYSLLTTGVYAGVAVFTVQLEQAGYIIHYSGLEAYPLLYTALGLPLILVLHDAYFYWARRLMHWRPIFRLMHLVHHRSPTPWAAYAFAPGRRL